MIVSTASASRIALRQQLKANSLRLKSAVRANSSYSNPTSTNYSSIQAGLIGGGAVFLLGYGWYTLSGTKQIVSTARTAIDKYEDAKKTVATATPNPSEALKFVRSTIEQYAGLVPGAKEYTDVVFKDIDQLTEKHGDLAEEIVSRTYNEIKEAVKNGLNAETANQIIVILQRRARELRSLANDVGDDIFKAHPDLQRKIGSQLEELKQLADKAGPEAKKSLDDAYEQIQAIAMKGLTPAGIASAGYLIQDAIHTVRNNAETAWKKGMESIEPVMDKYPKIKKLINENVDDLKSGNVQELFSTLTSGKSVSEMETYVSNLLSKAQATSLQDFVKYLKAIPGVDHIPHYQELVNIAQNHQEDAEKLVKETYDEIRIVLEKKAEKASKIVEAASNSGKKK